jgi:hypothetical protein
VLARQVGGETVILDLASGNYFGLDAMGAEMWQLMTEGRSLAEVCDAVETKYDVSRADLERDLLALAAELQSHGLIAFQA